MATVVTKVWSDYQSHLKKRNPFKIKRISNAARQQCVMTLPPSCMWQCKSPPNSGLAMPFFDQPISGFRERQLIFFYTKVPFRVKTLWKLHHVTHRIRRVPSSETHARNEVKNFFQLLEIKEEQIIETRDKPQCLVARRLLSHLQYPD